MEDDYSLNILMQNLFNDKSDFPFANSNNINNNNVKQIECECPEIGTKIEQFNEKNNNLKYYYNNNNKNMLFYPIFNMNKGLPNKNNKYSLVYFDEDLYDLYIFKHSKEEEIKIQINNKNIVQIIYDKTFDKIELIIMK